MRVLVTGMGGHLGTRVAQLLEARDDVEAVAGFDFVPPRRRLSRSLFKRIDPRDRDRLVEFVRGFAPTAVAHFGVYEPGARMGVRASVEASDDCTVNALGAAVRAGALDRVVVRSGLEVYGRGGHRHEVPDEHAPLGPTTPYGRICLDVEAHAAGLARRHGVPVAALRFAPISGSRAPSPLGRLLRLPAVPVPALADPPFQLLHTDDAARAMVAALVRQADGAFNVVGPGAASPWQAARLGNRVPVPFVGPGWLVATRVAELAGSPVPPHVLELIRKGCVADGGRAESELGLTDLVPTQEVVADLYAWASVTALPGSPTVAAPLRGAG
ncbi:MAG: NAD-dependent epimerase/dehydratase family protein [Actinobacteria bacterium]|nr:NAD-dependent epimerase/dehydratase family protein [Actinomycetota bacterium]